MEYFYPGDHHWDYFSGAYLCCVQIKPLTRDRLSLNFINGYSIFKWSIVTWKMWEGTGILAAAKLQALIHFSWIHRMRTTTRMWHWTAKTRLRWHQVNNERRLYMPKMGHTITQYPWLPYWNEFPGCRRNIIGCTELLSQPRYGYFWSLVCNDWQPESVVWLLWGARM